MTEQQKASEARRVAVIENARARQAAEKAARSADQIARDERERSNADACDAAACRLYGVAR